MRISPRRLRTALNNVRTRLAALNEDGMLRDFQEWTDSFDALHEHETLQMPQGFFSSAWNVYKATMQDPSYFFSIHELLLFARLARVNLVVTTYQQDEFCIAGSTGSVEDTSSVVYV